MAQPKIIERTLYPPLTEYIKKLGFESIGEASIDGGQSDILIKYKDLLFVVEVKLGDINLGLKAIAQAYDYAKKYHTNNTIILLFPEKLKDQTLIDFSKFEEVVLTKEIKAIILTEYWTESLTTNINSLFTKLKSKISFKEHSIKLSTIINLINGYVTELNGIIDKSNTDKIAEEVVNKLKLFTSIGEIKNPDVAKKQVLGLASFLLFNQLLFYHIYTKKTKREIPQLESITKITDLQNYINYITKIDYKAIYKINILGHIPDNKNTVNTLNDLIKAIKYLRAEYITEDLAGRFFHELIPQEIRKVLAAFYTNPTAANILSSLIINSYDDTVLDPSCGSGTLLVSAYNRKKKLYIEVNGYTDLDEMHKKFIENDITGIDIMPFAAHISAMNLTLQNINQETNTIRIATYDSLNLITDLKTVSFSQQGFKVDNYSESFQRTLFDASKQNIVEKGALSTDGKGVEFIIKPVDVVIMNPPFSDREKMPADMKIKLKENCISKDSGNTNLWAYFIVLSKYLLKKGGTVGCIIPISFARGQATQKIRNYVLSNFSIKYIVKSTKNLAFSENSEFKDILLIATNEKAADNSLVKIVFLKEKISHLESKVDELSYEIKNNNFKYGELYSNDILETFCVTQGDLRKSESNFMRFLSFSNIPDLLDSTAIIDGLSKFKICKTIDLNLLREGLGIRPKSISSVILITRNLSKARLKRATLVILKDGKSIVFKYKDLNEQYVISKEFTYKTIRTITGINCLDGTGKEDYIIYKDNSLIPKLRIISQYNKSIDWDKINKEITTIGFGNLCLPNRINLGSNNTHLISFYSENKFIPTGKFFKVFTNSIDEAKIKHLYFNSVISIIQILLYTSESTGAYFDIKKHDLKNFVMFEYNKLTELNKKELLDFFEKYKDCNLDSIEMQFQKKINYRIELDELILKIMGFNKIEIPRTIDKLYSIVLTELNAKRVN